MESAPWTSSLQGRRLQGELSPRRRNNRDNNTLQKARRGVLYAAQLPNP
jgi:hypothetical protein